MKQGFSLLEVLFAIAFLTMVGVAISVLSTATLRLTNQAEIQSTANALSDEAIGYLKANYYKDKSGFNAFISQCQDQGCYLTCSNSQISQNCAMSTRAKSDTIGKSRLKFFRLLKFEEQTNGYNIKITISWGSRSTERLELEHFLQ